MPSDADSLTEPDVDDPSAEDVDTHADADAVDVDQTQAHPGLIDDAPDDQEVGADLDASDAGVGDDTMAVEAVAVEDTPDPDAEAGFDEADVGEADGPGEGPTEDRGADTGLEFDQLVTAEDLGSDYSDDALLFDGDPDEFELDFAGTPYPDAVPQPGDMLVLDEPGLAPGAPPRRMSRMERRRRVRLQARRVRRIIRHIEPWSVLKISIFFYACLWVIFLVAGFIVWGVAESSGTVEKIEDLVTDLFALDSFDFDAGQIFRGYALGGLALSIAGTTFNVLMCLLFNLISDLTGGLRITMIEEETARPTPPRRRRRRAPPRG